MARGSVQRRFLQRLRGSALALDYNHGVAETSPFCECCEQEYFRVTLAALICLRVENQTFARMVEWAGVGTLTLLLVDNAPASLLSDDSNAPFANARVWASAVRNCHNDHDFVRTWRIIARNRHRIEMIKRPNIVLMG